jgi:hypothetical protein
MYIHSALTQISNTITQKNNNGAVISKNLLLLLDTIKAGILLMQKITAGTRGF